MNTVYRAPALTHRGSWRFIIRWAQADWKILELMLEETSSVFGPTGDWLPRLLMVYSILLLCLKRW